MIQNCNEQILEDVVKVELVLHSACTFPVPIQKSDITTMSATIGTATLVANYIGDSAATGEYDQAPTFQQTEKKQQIGTVVTHKLKVLITGGFEGIITAENALRGAYFHLVLTTADGTRYLSYALPNTSVATIDDQMGASRQMTLNVTLMSMNHIIRLV